MTEAGAIPANPDNEYGWEKLYSERVAMAYARRYGMQVRIARFQNCYGPEGHLARRPGESPGSHVPEDCRSAGWWHNRSLGGWLGHPFLHLRGRTWLRVSTC